MNFLTRIMALVIITGLTAIVVLAGCEVPKTEISYSIPDQPKLPAGYTPKPGWSFSEFAVASANPLATDAGYQILKAGGTAVDAAVSVQMVLTLVEPQSSGIGGGAFLLNWDGTEIHAFNGREIAPAAADENLFLDEEDRPIPFSDAVSSGLSVGVPGTIAMLKEAHVMHGRLDWADLFKPAITLAEEGFQISPRLHQQLDHDLSLRNDDIARELYYNEQGDAFPPGHTLRNPALAEILKKVSEEGLNSFYKGEVAKNIAERVQNHPERPGTMTTDDIAGYLSRDIQTEAICTEWRIYQICGFPPPSSGHLAIMQILGILEQLKLPVKSLQDSIPSAEWLHYYMESSKLAFADRNKYVADPDFVDPPAESWESLLGSEYLRKRSALIRSSSMGEADPGVPGPLSFRFGIHPPTSEKGTSHVSIVDRDGNAVSMTTTIEQGFGSRIMSDGGTGLKGGFHLNNELTDFSRTPADSEGRQIANKVEPGKQPRSSMSPSLVFDKETGEFVASVGSPGGAGIIHYTAKALLGMLYWDLNAQKAIDLPNFANYNGPALLEAGRFPTDIFQSLESWGHKVKERNMTSGIQAIQRNEDGLFGGADPRREGVVMGK